MTLGVTGDVGSGKSFVLRWMAEHGAAVLDADLVVRRLLEGHAPTVARVVERFGAGVRGASGAVDRAALADVVFADAAALADLERLVHPPVRAEAEAWLAAVPDGTPVAAVEAVKLVESGMHQTMDGVCLVVCDRAQRRRRLLDRGWLPEEIERRFAASAPLLPKLRVARLIIDNSGSQLATEAQLARAWRHLVGCPPEECDRACMG